MRTDLQAIDFASSNGCLRLRDAGGTLIPVRLLDRFPRIRQVKPDQFLRIVIATRQEKTSKSRIALSSHLIPHYDRPVLKTYKVAVQCYYHIGHFLSSGARPVCRRLGVRTGLADECWSPTVGLAAAARGAKLLVKPGLPGWFRLPACPVGMCRPPLTGETLG